MRAKESAVRGAWAVVAEHLICYDCRGKNGESNRLLNLVPNLCFIMAGYYEETQGLNLSSSSLTPTNKAIRLQYLLRYLPFRVQASSLRYISRFRPRSRRADRISRPHLSCSAPGRSLIPRACIDRIRNFTGSCSLQAVTPPPHRCGGSGQSRGSSGSSRRGGAGRANRVGPPARSGNPRGCSGGSSP
jgi:hypothetical protein